MPDKSEKPGTMEFIISVVATVVVAFVIAIWVPTPDHDPSKKVQLALAYSMLVLLFLFGFFIIAAIASGKINISQLLTEKDGDGKASMSRFQLLIFTFVIGVSFFMVVVSNNKLPEVPNQVLTLLGISATTYGVSKGIQASTTDSGAGDTENKGTK
jgi:quinol-cytochrome oxidoreductase complex cytochrome b subunit